MLVKRSFDQTWFTVIPPAVIRFEGAEALLANQAGQPYHAFWVFHRGVGYLLRDLGDIEMVEVETVCHLKDVKGLFTNIAVSSKSTGTRILDCDSRAPK
jgi:hypothetical protein